MPHACFQPLLAQHALAHADGVRVHDLERAVAVARHEALRERERVVIGGRVAEVQAHERDRRRAVGQHLDVARYEAEVLRVPRARRLVVRHLEHDVPEPDHLAAARRAAAACR